MKKKAKAAKIKAEKSRAKKSRSAKKNSKAALEREIRRLVDDVNYRMFEYENLTESNADINPLFIDAFTDLYEKGLSGVRMSNFGMRITPALYAKIDGRKKDLRALEIQRNELKDFLEMDIWSPVAKEEYDAVTEAKYQTYLFNTVQDEDKFTRTEWESMFDAFEILHERRKEFGYGDREASESSRIAGTNRDAANSYRNTYMKLDRQERRTFGDVLEKSLNYLKKKNMTINYQTIINEVERRFGLNQ